MSETGSSAWTAHGHPIPGATITGARPSRVARCGGPMICGKCKIEVMAAVTQAAHTEASIHLVESKSGKPEPILTGVEWDSIKRAPRAMTAVTVTTSADFEDLEAAYDAAVTQALTRSNGVPLTYEGYKRVVTPDLYKGGYSTGYAWTFTPLD